MASTYHTQIQKLYVAYFNRPADFLGLDYWEGVVERAAAAAGTDPVKVTAAVNATLAAISGGFAASAEYKAEYAGLDTEHVVGKIYQNLFGHAPDLPGLIYWSNGIRAGNFTIATAVTVIAGGAQGSDLVAFNNKVTAATAFTNALDTGAEVLAYSGEAALAAGNLFIAGVTNDASLAAAIAPAALNATIASIVELANPGTTFNLTTGLDTVLGTSGNDTINGGTLNTLSAFDNIDGGAGNDTLTILTDAATLPGGATIKNVENINVNASVAGNFTANASAYTGVKSFSVVSSAQAAGTLTVDSASGVTVNSAAATTGIINVGQSVAATGAVDVSKVITAAGNNIGGAINIKGGTTVNVSTSATNSGAAGTVVSQGDVTVTGTADTTSVTVKQSATVAAVAAAAETAVVDFGGVAAQNATIVVGGLTLTVTDVGGMTGAEIAAAFASLANGATGPNPAKGTFTGTLTGWSTGVVGAVDQITFTSTTNANVTNLAVTGTATITGVTTTNGTAGNNGITAGAIAITDVNAASASAAGKITTVSLENFGATTINSGALATLTLAGKGTTVTETAGALTTATATTLALNLNGVTTSGAVTLDADHTTLNIASSTATNTLANLAASGAKAVNISGDKALVVSAHTLDAAAVITSTNSTGVTITAELGTGVTFVGGAGDDEIGLGASTKASTLGAGDDVVTLSGAALGVDGSVAGGDGRDTLVLTAANAITATAGTAVANFSGKVTGFEVLAVGAVGVAGEIKVASLDNSSWNAIDTVLFTGAVGAAVTVSGLVSGDTIAFEATNGAATTAAVTGATAATADVLNVSISGTAGINVNTVIAADIETINFKTDDAATTASGIQHTAALTAGSVKTITVAGDAGLALTNTDTTVTSFDATGVTKGAVNWTTGALAAAATIKGGAGINTIDASLATKAVTYTGGAGVDNITISNANANVIDAGAGNDVITVGNGANTITAGAGNDTINLGSGANTVDTGAGTNSVNFDVAIAGLNKITLGSGVDTLDFDVVSTAAGYYPSVTGIAAGDKIDFVSAFAVADEATLGAKITLGGNASFANYLDAATATGGATAGQEVNWFQFNGNTYVTLDNSAEATFKDGSDLVIELVGLVDLSTSTLVAEVITIV
ncbi:DUF4214 domain-containing protein [Massilia sp. RP-1-19]|uniref:DUF4214 domain-containing protein n=1 Tax=Massilia polaris TaxID=2728846 RepID=A0A848HRG3_9BURK|nr:DUF4214 domain-containing protein [Massilia polaris]NML61178.1 DUF4214 domain-containing protein [Massilia polaris]